jgi:hypothetical protein
MGYSRLLYKTLGEVSDSRRKTTPLPKDPPQKTIRSKTKALIADKCRLANNKDRHYSVIAGLAGGRAVGLHQETWPPKLSGLSGLAIKSACCVLTKAEEPQYDMQGGKQSPPILDIISYTIYLNTIRVSRCLTASPTFPSCISY